MVEIEIPEDLPDTVWDEETARFEIDAQNEERDQEAREHLGDGDPDDFRYLRNPYFRMETQYGPLVAQIRDSPDGKCLRYNLIARIEQNGH